MATVVAAHQEHALDRCRGALRAAHAELGTGLVTRMAGRIPPDRAIRLYVRSLGLHAADAAWLCSAVGRSAACRHARTDSHDAPLRFHDWMRIHAAPWGNPGLADELTDSLAGCTRSAGVIAARHALAAAPPTAATNPSLQSATAFLERLDLSPSLHAAAFDAILRRFAGTARPLRQLAGSRGATPRFTRPGRPATRQHP